MSVLRDAISALWSFADWIDQAGRACNEIPLVGSVVGYPLRASATLIYSAAWSFYYFDQWIDGVTVLIANAYDKASLAYTYAVDTLYRLIVEIRSTAEATYGFIVDMVVPYIETFEAKLQTLWEYTGAWVTDSINDVFNRLDILWNYVSNTWNGLGPAVWSYITSGALQNYLTSWIAAERDYLISVVTGSLGYLITQGFTTLKDSWESFKQPFTWLTLQIIGLIQDEAATFSDALWTCFEIVVSKLTEWEEK